MYQYDKSNFFSSSQRILDYASDVSIPEADRGKILTAAQMVKVKMGVSQKALEAC